MRNVNEVTIASGASLSDPTDLSERTLVGIEMPDAWTAADLTFQAGGEAANFENLYDETGTEITVTAAASRYIAINPDLFVGVRFLKVRSGTAALAVNQGADRILKLILQ